MKSGKYTLDRFEGEKAVLLYRGDESIELVTPKENLPQEAKEGDVLSLDVSIDGKVISAEVLTEETENARVSAKNLLDRLRKK